MKRTNNINNNNERKKVEKLDYMMLMDLEMRMLDDMKDKREQEEAAKRAEEERQKQQLKAMELKIREELTVTEFKCVVEQLVAGEPVLQDVKTHEVLRICYAILRGGAHHDWVLCKDCIYKTTCGNCFPYFDCGCYGDSDVDPIILAELIDHTKQKIKDDKFGRLYNNIDDYEATYKNDSKALKFCDILCGALNL